MEEKTIYVAGAKYYDFPKAVEEGLYKGTLLNLEQEPTNKYDNKAVKILWNGLQIGYVPKPHNKEVFELLDEGYDFYVQVVKIKPFDPITACLITIEIFEGDSND